MKFKVKSKAIGTKPCPSCRAQGRDRTGNNLVLYKDNSGFCFVCDKRFANVDSDYEETELTDKSSFVQTNFTKEYVAHRGLTKATLQTYGVSVRVDPQSTPQWIEFPYGPDGRKLKGFKEKKFFFEGSAATALPLFGMDKFGAASARAITLTEGEHDALAAYQMLGSKYPVVSVRSSGEALKNCQDSYDYLNSFDKIYICFDNDDPGHKATKEVASLFDPSKTYIVNLSQHKDANDYLVNNKTDEFTKTWWNSKKYIPKGIVSEFSSVEEALKKKSAEPVGSYPFATLDSMTYGIRLGEINLFTAQEKIGKTEIFRAIEHHLLKTTNERLGLIHLEEDDRRTICGLVGYEAKVPAHLPDSGLSDEDKLKIYKDLVKTDDRVFMYSHFGSDDPNTILSVIRYLVQGCKCKFVFLDHITMLATGFEDDDERKKLDFISTRLAMMVRELDFTLFMISHVNDDGKTRGSRNISKVADLIVSINRDKESEDPEVRNTTKLMVLGNRFGSTSGPAGLLKFDTKTFTLHEMNESEKSFEAGF